MVSKKVILTGTLGVGKTSLFNRFLYSKFDEKYLTTIGVKVDKKMLMIDGRALSLLVWDIAGEMNQDKVPPTYFLGSSALVYVFDLTRKTTYENILADILFLKNRCPGVVIKVIGNKKDLVTPEKLEETIGLVNYNVDFTTSAKSGENVEELFMAIGAQLLDNV